MTIQELYDKCKIHGVENRQIEIRVNDLQNSCETYVEIDDIYLSLLGDKITIECNL